MDWNHKLELHEDGFRRFLCGALRLLHQDLIPPPRFRRRRLRRCGGSMHNQWKIPSSDAHGSHPEEWVIQIKQSLLEEIDGKDEEEDYENIMVSIASVPKFLQSSNPESYLPHLIAIGPYHHSQAELRDMDQFKISAAKRIQKQLNGIKLQQVVVEFIRAEQKIRSHYHSLQKMCFLLIQVFLGHLSHQKCIVSV